MTNWKRYNLSEVVDKGRGISYGIVQPGTFVDDGIPIIKVNNLTDRKLSFSDVQKVKPEVEVKYQRTKLRGNEILISLVGSLGHIAKVNEEMIGWNVARAVGVLPISDSFDKEWIFWFLKSPQAQSFVHGQATTSVQATLNLKELQELQIAYPDEAYRKKATEILSALDDKIVLNRCMNQTLEQMVQTLFRQYFVDGINEENLPVGWRVGTLGDIVNVKGGTTPSTKQREFWNGSINWTSPKDLSSVRFPVLLNTEKTITEAGLKKISSGLLPVGTLLLSSRAPIGYLAITQIPVAINQGYIAILCEKGYSNFFMLFWLKENMSTIIQNANGSTFLEISKSVFKNIDLSIPPVELVKKFDAKVDALFQKLVLNEKESIKLIQLRDTLLPKLMSGEIDVMQTKPEDLHEPILS